MIKTPTIKEELENVLNILNNTDKIINEKGYYLSNLFSIATKTREKYLSNPDLRKNFTPEENKLFVSILKLYNDIKNIINIKNIKPKSETDNLKEFINSRKSEIKQIPETKKPEQKKILDEIISNDMNEWFETVNEITKIIKNERPYDKIVSVTRVYPDGKIENLKHFLDVMNNNVISKVGLEKYTEESLKKTLVAYTINKMENFYKDEKHALMSRLGVSKCKFEYVIFYINDSYELNYLAITKCFCKK